MAKLRKYLFIIHSILALGFGLGFIFLPKFLGTLLGFSDQADTPTIFRYFGTAVLAVSVLVFLLRNEEFSNAIRSVLIFLIFFYGLMTVLHFIFGDLTNIWLWSVIVLHVIFIGLYVYCIFKKE